MTAENSFKLYRMLPAWLNSAERALLEALANESGWQEGRQGTGYEKLDLLPRKSVHWVIDRALETMGSPNQFDAWLLRYPSGSEIPPHTDQAERHRCHIRLNGLVVAGVGGMLRLGNDEVPLDNGDAYLFRPDVIQHSVLPIEAGTRLVVSVGANVDAAHAHDIGLA